MKKIKIAIDASRSKSGGIVAHIIGVLKAMESLPNPIGEIHIWSYNKLLKKLPNHTWLIKHNHQKLEKKLVQQLWWQYYIFPKELKKIKIDILLNTSASTINSFNPSVTMSRDMLSFEEGEMNRYGISLQRIRLLILKYVQINSLKNSKGTIFLTNYAANTIQKFTGTLKNKTIIPHGITNNFRMNMPVWLNSDKKKTPINCVYVSNIMPYKHQEKVAEAFYNLNRKGFNISITFVGEGLGKQQKEFYKRIKKLDPEGKFLFQIQHTNHLELPNILKKMDVFVFASSCENMPNTLLEGMASGLPIVCSNRGPMPEVLKDGGIYFDPENVSEFEDVLVQLIRNEELRLQITSKSKEYAKEYGWKRCSKETFDFIIETFFNEC